MIAVSIHPDEIPVDRQVEVRLRLANTGPGVCTNVRLTFRLPLEVLLVQGRQQVQVARLGSGERHDHPIQVRGRKEGTFHLVSTNFSYRDPAGRSRRISEAALPLRVVAPPHVPLPALEFVLETTTLPAEAWGSLSGQIANVGEGRAHAIVLSASGPSLQAHEEKMGDLPSGEKRPFTLPVRASEMGPRVPIRLEAAFRDEDGQPRRCGCRAYVAVERAHLGADGLRIQIGTAQIGEISTGKTETHLGDVGMIRELQVGGRKKAKKSAPPPRFCPDCGAALPTDEGMRFCPNCGRRL